MSPYAHGSANDAAAVESLPHHYIIGDTHYHYENADYLNPNDRQIDAINVGVTGRSHPLGGRIQRADIVTQIGDAVHEGDGNMDRFAADYSPDGGGRVRARCEVLRGNHDRKQVEDYIIAKYGSLTWGFELGGVWWQAMTENYTSPIVNTPPSVAQIAAVDALLAARPAAQRKVVMVHRALSGGYRTEWDRTQVTTITQDMIAGQTTVTVASAAALSIGQYIQIETEEMQITNIVGLTLTVVRGFSTTHANGQAVYRTDALDALAAMVVARNVIAIFTGHDHYNGRGDFRQTGIRHFRPGSVTQAPNVAPYSTTYPESFIVTRIGETWLDVACWRFGFTANPRGWNPNAWEWWERIYK